MNPRIALFGSLTLLAACDPQHGTWGLEAVETMATPLDGDAGCGVVLPADTNQASRAACTFNAGAKPEATFGISPAQARQIPVRHVVVMMKENRSFDHLLGMLSQRGQPNAEPLPASFTNPDKSGAEVPFSHATTTCLPNDPQHQFSSITHAVNGGKMDGFVKNAASTTSTDGHFVMTYYDQPDLPFYYWLATTYAMSDRHFSPAQSGTYCNRNYMLFADARGAIDTGIAYPEPNTPSLLHLLLNAGYTWRAYSDDLPLEGTTGWTHKDPGTRTMADFYADAAAGRLPSVAFVDADEDITDDHPVADLQKGEVWFKKVYDAVVASPQWGTTALLWTYDEGGGFPDHVPPPNACQSIPGSPFKALGVRVPLVAISPWAKRNYVSHIVTDHTAITRFIETVFGLPALTARDANSDNLLDLFDFSCGRNLAIPTAPAPGSGSCANPP